jgi:DNA-binding transcriptional LysR family regulator
MNLRGVDLNLLPVLDALLSEKSTVRAAEVLGMSQSAVSAALSRLRGTLGDPLFVREGQRIVPTEFAVSLEVPLRDILQGVENLVEGQRGFDPSRATDNFKLSGSDFYAEMLMPKLAGVFSRETPFMQLQMVDLVPDNYVGSLDKEGIDLALVPKRDFPSWVASQTGHHSAFTFVARRNHPKLARAGLAPGDVVPVDLVADLGYILFSPEGKLTGMGDAALARIGRSRKIAMTLPVMNGVLSAVASSDLCAFIPLQIAMAKADILGLDLYQLPFPMPRVEISMIWHERFTSSPAHTWLRERVAEVLAEVDALSVFKTQGL